MRSWHKSKTSFAVAFALGALLLGAPALGWADPAVQADASDQSEAPAKAQVQDAPAGEPAPEAQSEETIGPAAAEVLAAQNAQLAAQDAPLSPSSASGQTASIPAADIVPLVSIQFVDPSIDYATLTKEQGYQAATVTVQGIGGMDAVPGQTDFTATDAQVKIRGNTTSSPYLKKRPLNIKFSAKQGLLGMPEGKTWVLLADAFDATLLRNYLALDLARAMGIPGSAEHRMVQVMVNGQYKGVFELTQQAKKLVKVDIAAGGFIVEAVSDNADEADVTYLRSSPSGINFELSEPDPATADQKAAVQTKLNEVDAAICSGDWNRVQAVVDTASFAKMYVLQEYVKNFDQVNSFFFYWQDGKLHSGMPWDFDLSQGNVNPGIGGDYYMDSGSQSEAYSGIWHMGQGIGRGHWFDDLIKYQGFYDQVMAAWKEAQTPIAEKDSAQAVDVALATYGEVLKGNYQEAGGPWDINEYIDFRRGTEKTFGEAINYLKNYLTQRKAWLDQNLATELEKKVQYKDVGPVVPDNPVVPTQLPAPTGVCWDSPDRTAPGSDGKATNVASAFWDTGSTGTYGVQVLKDGATVVGQGITDENGFDFPVKQAGTYTFKVCAYPADASTELQSEAVDSGTQTNGTLVTVSMDPDGGALPDGAPGVAVAIKGQGAGVLPVPTKSGFAFEGWKRSDGSAYDPAVALSAPETVTAQWKANTPAAATKIDVPSAVGGLVYNGGRQTGVRAGTGYAVTGNTATNAGTYTATVTPAAGYCWQDGSTGARQVAWSIGQADISGAEVSAPGQTYNGSALRPAPTVKLGGKAVPERAGGAANYAVTWSDNVNAGTGAVTVKGAGNYKGAKSAQFKIAQRPLTAADIQVSDVTYNGKAQTPAKVVACGRVLGASECSVSYRDNVNVGTATVTVAGKGNFCGTAPKRFSIGRAAITSASASAVTWNGGAQTPRVSAKAGSLAATVSASPVPGKNNTSVGTGWVRVTGTGNFCGSKDVTFAINKGRPGWVAVGGRQRWSTGSSWQTGWLKAAGQTYWLGADGYMRTGWQDVDGQRYLFRGKGNPYGPEGSMGIGWLKEGGSWYIFRRSGSPYGPVGSMGKGWLADGGKWYFFDRSTGRMATGWVADGGSWYYLSASGAMVTGWLKEGGSWYYLDGSGKMLTGWYRVGRDWYWSDASGRMASDRWVGRYWVDASGRWTRTR